VEKLEKIYEALNKALYSFNDLEKGLSSKIIKETEKHIKKTDFLMTEYNDENQTSEIKGDYNNWLVTTHLNLTRSHFILNTIKNYPSYMDELRKLINRIDGYVLSFYNKIGRRADKATVFIIYSTYYKSALNYLDNKKIISNINDEQNEIKDWVKKSKVMSTILNI